VSAYAIGDAEFLGVPGEVFPYVIVRGFQGVQDMPFPKEAMSPWVMPHASKPFRFIEGLGEAMDGYLFSQNNATAVPEVDGQRGHTDPGLVRRHSERHHPGGIHRLQRPDAKRA